MHQSILHKAKFVTWLKQKQTNGYSETTNKYFDHTFAVSSWWNVTAH